MVKFNPLKLESDMCLPISNYFKETYPDCEIFYEVKSTYSKKIDIVIKTKDGSIITCELKLHANLQIINQAYNNLKYGNYSYIAIPEKSLRSFSKNLVQDICKGINIGLLLITTMDHQVKEIQTISKINQIKKNLSLLENQKTYTIGGEASGKCWSDYKETISKIEKYLESVEEESLIDIMIKTKHHYKNVKSGAQTIKNYINIGIIKTLIINKNGTVSLRK